MLTSPLIYKVETYIIYQIIALIHIYILIYCITTGCKDHYRGMTLKTTFQNFHIKFSNSDSSVDIAIKLTKSLRDVLCSPLEGSVSSNFDSGPGYFFMLCRKFVKVFVHYF